MGKSAKKKDKKASPDKSLKKLKPDPTDLKKATTFACEYNCGKTFNTLQKVRQHQTRWCKNNENSSHSLSLSQEIVEEAEKTNEHVSTTTKSSSTNAKQQCRFCGMLVSARSMQAHESSNCTFLKRIDENNSRKKDPKFIKKEYQEVTERMKQTPKLPIGKKSRIPCEYCHKDFENLKLHQYHCKEKTRIDKNKRKIKKQNSNKLVPEEFICQFCSSQFASQSVLNKHLTKFKCPVATMKQVKTIYPNLVKCPKCKLYFGNNNNLRDHLRRTCKEAQTTEPSDIQANDDGDSWNKSCHHCHKKFDDKLAYRYHLDVCSEVPTKSKENHEITAKEPDTVTITQIDLVMDEEPDTEKNTQIDLSRDENNDFKNNGDGFSLGSEDFENNPEVQQIIADMEEEEDNSEAKQNIDDMEVDEVENAELNLDNLESINESEYIEPITVNSNVKDSVDNDNDEPIEIISDEEENEDEIPNQDTNISGPPEIQEIINGSNIEEMTQIYQERTGKPVEIEEILTDDDNVGETNSVDKQENNKLRDVIKNMREVINSVPPESLGIQKPVECMFCHRNFESKEEMLGHLKVDMKRHHTNSPFERNIICVDLAGNNMIKPIAYNKIEILNLEDQPPDVHVTNIDSVETFRM